MKRFLRRLVATTSLALAAAASAQPMAPAVPTGDKAMPPGHPSVSGMMNATPSGDTAAASQPVVRGSLTVQVIAGSAGGAISTQDPVTVDILHRGASLRKISDLKLGADGKLTIPNIPVVPPVNALISITHAGLLQQILGPELNAANPNQSLQMKVFETTEQQPVWSVAMQHMIVQWAADGSGERVLEVLAANTPGDRAWLGAKSDAGKRVTMFISLPPGANQIELGGNFDDEVSTLVDGKIVTGSALFPGRSEFRLTYTVPAKNGALELPIASPSTAAGVENLMVFLPADDVQVTATGISGGNAVDMGEGKVRMFRAQNLVPGAVASLSIRGIKAAAGAGDMSSAAAVAATTFSARNVALGGIALMVVVGVGIMMFKKPQRKTARRV